MIRYYKENISLSFWKVLRMNLKNLPKLDFNRKKINEHFYTCDMKARIFRVKIKCRKLITYHSFLAGINDIQLHTILWLFSYIHAKRRKI